MKFFQTCLVLVFLMGNFCFGKNVQKEHFRGKKKHQNLFLNDGDNRSYYHENPNGPGTYSFGYYIHDIMTGNFQLREEEKFANRTVKGAYSHLRPDGKVSITRYIADESGYHSNTETYKQDKYKSNKTTKKPIPYNTTKKPTEDSSTTSPEMVESILRKSLFPTNQVNGQDSQTSSIKNEGVVVPITTNSNGTIGFGTLNDFIPKSFPLVPFQLPKNIVNKRNN